MQLSGKKAYSETGTRITEGNLGLFQSVVSCPDGLKMCPKRCSVSLDEDFFADGSFNTLLQT